MEGKRVNFTLFCNYDKEAPDADVEHSVLGLQSYWDATYEDELANFHEHGHTGEVWVKVHESILTYSSIAMYMMVALTMNCKSTLPPSEIKAWLQ
ncbi:hypothetical protein AQUCO_01500342v1 [Aquilegia coerulea]|uniref:Uncharacterized protein n=1 Tax=Aquilegia coerulea TaxID=218851 RepID=A0A2G5DT92_AQUCA|nr:hypothetical protein AQUCO_01500342v1 [Aquilegia coerulea]